jgi:hypothetical protein
MARKAKAKPIVTLEYALEELRKPKVRPSDLGITYKLLHDWNITSEGRVEHTVRQFNPGMAKGGITQRTRKIWNKIYDIAIPSGVDRVEASLWKVSFYSGAKISTMGHPKKPLSMNSWNHPLGEVRYLGHVSAATRDEAIQLAGPTFGPLAMLLPECITVERVGPDGFLAKSKTEEAVKETDGIIQGKRDQITMLQWEISQLETLQAFQKMHGEE